MTQFNSLKFVDVKDYIPALHFLIIRTNQLTIVRYG